MLTITFGEYLKEQSYFLLERGMAEINNLNDAKGKLFELLVGGHLKHGTEKNGIPKGWATHYRAEGDGPQDIHDKIKKYLDTHHPGSYEEIAKHSKDAADHLKNELTQRGHHIIDDVAWTSQKSDHKSFTDEEDPNATADLMIKSRDQKGNVNKPIGISLKYGTQKDPNLKNPGIETLENLSALKDKTLDKLRQSHYSVLRSLGYGDKVGSAAAKERYNQLYTQGSDVAKKGDEDALNTQREISKAVTKGLTAASKKDPNHLREVVKRLIFPPTTFQTLRHHTHVGPKGAALHHTNDTEEEAEKTANAFEEYRVRPHSGGVTSVIEGRRKGSEQFEPAINLSTKTTSSYSGKGFNAIVKAPFLKKIAHEEPPITGNVTKTKPDNSKPEPTSPSELASHTGYHRIKNLLSQFRTSVPMQQRRVAQTGSPFQSMARPGIKRKPPSQRLAPNGYPEHMHQAHKDTTYMGHQDT
jgi:hypothetical protein